MERRKLKEKAKKVATIIGKAAIVGFALFGAVCAGILIANAAKGGDKKQEPTSSKRLSALQPMPADILGDGDEITDVTLNAAEVTTKAANEGYSVMMVAGVSAGWYRLTCEASAAYDHRLFLMSDDGIRKVWAAQQDAPQDVTPLTNGTDYYAYWTPTEEGEWFYLSPSDVASFPDFAINWKVRGDLASDLWLERSSTRPALADLELGEEWLPTAWVSRSSAYEYPLDFTQHVTKAQASNGFVEVGWDNVLFSTDNDARLFDGFRVTYRYVWDGARIKLGEQVATYDFDARLADGFPLFAYRCSYRDASTGQWFAVAEQAYDWEGNVGIITGELKWVNARYRSLTFYEAPQSPQYLTICRYTNDGGINWSPYPAMVYYGLTFGDWFGLESSWAAPNVVDVGTGNALTFVGDAFASIIPILSIQILPNISLGLLVFLPLIAGIVVLIVKVVSK